MNLVPENKAATGSAKCGCVRCGLRDRCLTPTLNIQEITEIDQLLDHDCSAKRRAIICKAGTQCRYIYAIRSGAVKSTVEQNDGRIQVTGVHLPGEWIGLDAIQTGAYHCSYVALKESRFCAISFNAYRSLTASTVFQRQFVNALSDQLLRAYDVMLWLGRLRIEERIAQYLLDLSKRFVSNGAPNTEFDLLLTREEMGNYLGSRLETVSRIFSRFHDEGLVKLKQGKRVVITDPQRLRSYLPRARVHKRMVLHPLLSVPVKSKPHLDDQFA